MADFEVELIVHYTGDKPKVLYAGRIPANDLTRVQEAGLKLAADMANVIDTCPPFVLIPDQEKGVQA